MLFYAAMVDEINDEADDALEDYSELIVTRMLAGRALPSLNSGSNNSCSIAPGRRGLCFGTPPHRLL